MGVGTRALETYVAYKLLDLIATPFSSWEAFEMGLIDEQGKKIKEAKTNEEKEQFSKFMNIARNLKRIMAKYTGIDNKLSAVLIGTALLKECVGEQLNIEIVETVLVESLGNKYLAEEVVVETLDAGRYQFESEFYESPSIIYIKQHTVSNNSGFFELEDCKGNTVLALKEQLTRI